ncbi:hypothetical protein C8Q80DRAFT_1153659 [Daedaleopsis nitida]|nr:hypothetical protein C8Q80DRAFT_1153659 [Daedaleopsis nitida]
MSTSAGPKSQTPPNNHSEKFTRERIIRPLPTKQFRGMPEQTKVTDPVQRNCEYYFEDGNVILRVEDIWYKLHRSQLERHSPIFRELFTIPQPEHSNEGLSDDNPIVLSGIQAINFTRLLWLIYPPILGTCKITTVDEWMSIFEQADRWQMDGLRTHALSQLRGLYIEPIRKIIFWLRYNLPINELIPAYADILTRPQSLSVGEAHEIGLEMFVKIAQARDMLHADGLCRYSHKGFSVGKDQILANVIKRVFGLPVAVSNSAFSPQPSPV